MNQFVPCLTVQRDGPELAAITLGHPLLDDYLAFVGARARTNSWLAATSPRRPRPSPEDPLSEAPTLHLHSGSGMTEARKGPECEAKRWPWAQRRAEGHLEKTIQRTA